MTIPEPAGSAGSASCGKQRRFKAGDRVRLLPAQAVFTAQTREEHDAPDWPLLPEGPFTIEQVLTATSYRLSLPFDWDFPLLSVVHASRLAPWDPPHQHPLGTAHPTAPRTPRSHPITFYTLDSPEVDECEDDTIIGVRVGNDKKTAKKACLFRIRWAAVRDREDSWEPYSAVCHLPAVRAFLQSDEFKEFKGTDPYASFHAKFPERVPRRVRFAPSAE